MVVAMVVVLVGEAAVFEMGTAVEAMAEAAMVAAAGFIDALTDLDLTSVLAIYVIHIHRSLMSVDQVRRKISIISSYIIDPTEIDLLIAYHKLARNFRKLDRLYFLFFHQFSLNK